MGGRNAAYSSLLHPLTTISLAWHVSSYTKSHFSADLWRQDENNDLMHPVSCQSTTPSEKQEVTLCQGEPATANRGARRKEPWRPLRLLRRTEMKKAHRINTVFPVCMRAETMAGLSWHMAIIYLYILTQQPCLGDSSVAEQLPSTERTWALALVLLTSLI